jgi:hypothetical protein
MRRNGKRIGGGKTMLAPKLRGPWRCPECHAEIIGGHGHKEGCKKTVEKSEHPNNFQKVLDFINSMTKEEWLQLKEDAKEFGDVSTEGN